ncbi:protein of unknown function [Pararobbsia alpina]|uniref:hypothetical protein n=1 Tax=Pararobbsia alpina TaxID=621374 RepID=UPI0039A71F9C
MLPIASSTSVTHRSATRNTDAGGATDSHGPQAGDNAHTIPSNTVESAESATMVADSAADADEPDDVTKCLATAMHLAIHAAEHKDESARRLADILAVQARMAMSQQDKSAGRQCDGR